MSQLAMVEENQAEVICICHRCRLKAVAIGNGFVRCLRCSYIGFGCVQDVEMEYDLGEG